MGMILHALAGFCSGIVSGMGFGGGMILIPVLTLLLGFDQKVAQGINLLYFIPTGLVALWVHSKNKSIETKTAWIVASIGVAGAIGGAYLAGVMPSALLRRVFAVVIIGVGFYEFYIAARNK